MLWTPKKNGLDSLFKEVRVKTSLSCTAADFEKIAPGWEKCVKIVHGTLPAWVPGDSEKCAKIVREPHFLRKNCAKVVRTQFSHDFGERWLRGPESASAQVLRIFLESQAVRAINVSRLGTSLRTPKRLLFLRLSCDLGPGARGARASVMAARVAGRGPCETFKCLAAKTDSLERRELTN